MKYSLTYSNASKNDLRNIFLYIAADNLPRAVTYIDEIEAVIKNLLLFPRMGRVMEERPNHRRLIHGNHKIIYELNETNKRIMIKHVKNCAQMDKG